MLIETTNEITCNKQFALEFCFNLHAPSIYTCNEIEISNTVNRLLFASVLVLVRQKFPNVNVQKTLVITKGETITRVNGNVSFFAGKRLQNF